MLRHLISLFLLFNSFFGLLFYQDTAFGNWLSESDLYSFIFILVNFILSHILTIFININGLGLGTLSFILLTLLLLLFLVALALYIPYVILYVWFDASGLFFMVIYVLLAIFFLQLIAGPLVKKMIDGFQIGVDAFFIGLTQNTVNRALEKANKKDDPS